MNNEIHPKKKSISQAHLDVICPSNEFNYSTMESSLDSSEQHPQVQSNFKKRSSMFATASNLSMSNVSLGENSSCTLTTTHQYHYIQYPPYYQTAMPQSPLSPPPSSCHCHCSCGARDRQQQQHHQQHRMLITPSSVVCHPHQDSVDSQIIVQVHRQAGGGTEREHNEHPTKAQSEQSLLNHSYQTLQLQNAADSLVEEKPLNVLIKSELNVSCDCDLQCTCSDNAGVPAMTRTGGAATSAQKHRQYNVINDVMLGADEITVSESDNNSTMIKKKSSSKNERECSLTDKRMNSWCTHDSNYNTSHIDIYSDGDGGAKDNDSEDHRPPLPPRPPPPPRLRNATSNANAAHRHGAGIKKYVVWCLICGGFSCLLGVLFLGVYFLLHSYTITVGNFETVPTFVPATLLILTGLCIMSLARRRNRYSYLIKLSGACGLISALTCALVTVTTTVLHMSRLQALRECEYAQKTRTCTCYSDMIESQVDRVDKEGVRLVFDSLSDCGVVHGSLYSCLRAIFGLSVAGVLIAVFSCMLVYQLLSHERKKMYWEQLELRCRSLYTSQQGPPTNVAGVATGPRGPICRCCEQCHAHRQVPLQAAAYPWDDGGEPRFWTGQPPGNFYSPNPGGDDLHVANMTATCRGHGIQNTRSRVTGWSWPRMPWQRNSPDPNSRFRQTPSSPDSQYGFTNSVPAGENIITEESTTAAHNTQTYNVVAGSLPYGVWGPPPPYSDPNSPARRGYYQYIQPNVCNSNAPQNDRPLNGLVSEQHMPCLNHRAAFLDQPNSGTACCAQSSNIRNSAKRQTSNSGASVANFKSKGGEYENTPSDSDGGARDHLPNTLPTRKAKKRMEMSAKMSIGPSPQPAVCVNAQQVYSTESNCVIENDIGAIEQEYRDNANSGLSDEANDDANNCNTVRMPSKPTPRHRRSVENSAFHDANNDYDVSVVDAAMVATKGIHETCDPTESEVYFADVSSCCNMSVKNDNYYEDANQSQPQQQQHHHHHHHHHQNSNCSHNSSSNNEDYLAQRFGQRENSIRSRLPFPQARNDEYEDSINMPQNSTKNSSIAAATAKTGNQMQKEISRQSMCSVESEAKTEFTDLSPSTPCSNKFSQSHFITTSNSNKLANELSDPGTRALPNFIATLPYSSESQSLEAHRRSTKDLHELMLAPEAHYEVINDTTNTCQVSVSPNVRSSHKSNQRPTNLISTNTKSKAKTKSRERLDVSAAFQTEMEWSEGSGSGGGGDRQCL